MKEEVVANLWRGRRRRQNKIFEEEIEAVMN